MRRFLLKTDSYKIGGHWNMLPPGTQKNFAYFEARKGAKFPYTVFFGLQALLKKNFEGAVVTPEGIEQAARLCKRHFGNDTAFNRAGWEYIYKTYGGRLPLLIHAIPEGTVVPIDNVLMTVENTDDNCPWLTGYVESILTHVWYPTTVATLSYYVKQLIGRYIDETSESSAKSSSSLHFMLHDFGYRGVSSDESAEIGGAAHLVNFLGTDTVPAIQFIDDYYSGPDNKNYEGIAYSVPATEHSIMTALGKDGEVPIVGDLLQKYPKGILSVVADSYDIYYFVSHVVGKFYKDQILAREGTFVVRPDSISALHPTPESMMVWIVESLWNSVGGDVNSKGFKVIHPKVRVLWGDGIDAEGIEKILAALKQARFSVDNIATFGMGGGLLQKVNRDTQRFAFKSSAQQRNGVWHNVFKSPQDLSKASKKGRIKLVLAEGAHGAVYSTVSESDRRPSVLVPVFANGTVVNESTFAQVRERAKARVLT